MRLLGLLTLGMVALGPGPVQSPGGLIRQLGSGRYVEREEAARSLEAIGREALPALYEARQDDDPEIRARAVALAESIQKRSLVEPMMVRLDAEDRPLAEVVGRLNEQTGMSVQLYPENAEVWQGVRVTVREEEPVPFWTAMDRLTEASGTQMQMGPPIGFGGGAARSGVRLVQGRGPRLIHSDSGPFRCSLLSLHHHRDLTFQGVEGAGADPAAGAAGFTVIDQFHLTMQVAAEPRLLLHQAGTVRVSEAMDDRGESLVPTEPEAPNLRGSGYFGMGAPTTSFQVQANLAPPGDGSKSLRRLRGSIPVRVGSPRPRPLEIALEGSVGRRFRSEEAEVGVDALQVDPNGQRHTVELTIRSLAEGVEADDPFNLMGGRFALALPTRLEVVDGAGRPFRLQPSRTQANDGQSVQVTLSLLAIRDQGVPVTLRFYDLVSTATEVEFEFTGVPLP